MRFFTKTELRIFLIFWIIFSVFATSDRWNDNASLDLTMAIVDEHRFEIDSYANNTGDRTYYNGHYYSDKVPGTALLAVPLYQVYKIFVGKIPYYSSLDEDNPSWKYHLFLFLAISLISAVCGALTVVLVYKISRYFTSNNLHRNLVVIVLGLGTLLPHAGRQFNSHAISTFFIFLCFYLIFKFKKKNEDNFFIAGLIGGLAALTAYRTIIILIFCFIFILTFKKYKLALKFVLGFLIPFSILLLYSYSVYGNVFETNWQHPQGSCITNDFIIKHAPKDYLLNAFLHKDTNLCDDIPSHDLREYCIFRLKSFYENDINYCNKISSLKFKTKCYVRYVFPTPYSFISKLISFFQKKYSVINFLRLLFGPFRGLIFYFPIMLLAFIGLFYMYKNDYKKETIVILTSFLTYMLLNSVSYTWWVGSSFGQRHFTDLTPFFMMPILFSFRKINKKVVFFLAIVSIIITIIGLQSVHWSYSKNIDILSGNQQYFDRLNSWKPISNPLFENYIPNLFHLNHKELLLEKIFNVNLIPFVNIGLLIFSFLWLYYITNRK